jgi:hypothetical protein
MAQDHRRYARLSALIMAVVCADTPVMLESLERSAETLVELRYPNGRSAERVLPVELQAGDEFELYGRHWQVVATAPLPRSRERGPRRLVCESIAQPPGNRAGDRA